MNSDTRTQAPLNFILFMLLALLWSGSFINIKIVVGEFPPIFCALIRVLLSLVFLSLFFIHKNVFSLRRDYWRLWVVGFFAQGLPFALLFFGEKYIAPALASIINSTVTIWSLVLGVILFKDFMNWTPVKIVGIVLGFIGITIIFLPFIHGSESSLIGIMAVMGMAISYAIGSLISQHIVFKKMQVSLETTIIQQHFASVLFLLAASLACESWPSLSSLIQTKTLLAFLYLGIMATAIAWVIYFHLIREWGAVRAVSVTYLVPMLAIVWDAVFLHSLPTLSEIWGMVMILISIILIQWTKKTKAY